MGIDEDYMAWVKETMTQYDKEVTKALMQEVAAIPKKLCNKCSRLLTKNECECGLRDTECYYCHLKNHA